MSEKDQILCNIENGIEESTIPEVRVAERNDMQTIPLETEVQLDEPVEKDPRLPATEDVNLINHDHKDKEESQLAYYVAEAKEMLLNTGVRIKEVYQNVRSSPVTTEAKDILQKTCVTVGKATKQTAQKVKSWIDARQTCMVIGIILSIITGVAVLACIGGFVFVNVGASVGQRTSIRFSWTYNGYHDQDVFKVIIFQQNTDLSFSDLADILLTNSFMAAIFILFLLEFSFSAVLAHGACESKVSHLYAYLVYGNIKATLLLIASILINIIDVQGSTTAFLLSVGSAVVSALVYNAYRKIEMADKIPNHESMLPAASEKNKLEARMCVLVTGIVKSIISGLLVVAGIVGIVYQIAVTELNGSLNGVARKAVAIERDESNMILKINCVTVAGLICFLLDFTFSIVLAVGASKRNAASLKAYFTYGVMKTAAALLLSIAVLVVVADARMIGGFGLVFCGLNTMSLLMVSIALASLKKAPKHSTFVNEVVING